jgi:transcriptional regulator with XRE-family HTH domain
MKTRWADELHTRIAKAIRTARKDKMSAEHLADECTRLGYPISRSTLANYETGRKKRLDVADLMVIAKALDVSPLALLFNGEPDQLVEMLPGQTETTLAAIRWFVGDPDWLNPAVRDQLDMLFRAMTGSALRIVRDAKREELGLDS